MLEAMLNDRRNATLERARQLIREGYYQVSITHRTVARVPDGISGRVALAMAAHKRSDAWEWAYRLGESHATDHYLRCYSPDKLQLEPALWKAFKKLGGRAAA